MRRAMVWLVVWLSSAAPVAAAEGPPSGPPRTAAERLIRQAGNAEDDGLRLALLRQLRALPGLDQRLAADCDRMIAAVERWVHSKHLPYFGGEVSRRVDYDFGIAPDSPLYPLTCLYRGRMLVWVTLESGGIIGDEDRRRQFLDKAVREFRAAQAAFPENRLMGMYLGRPIPWQKELAGQAEAPRWAAVVRENLERLTDIIHWWIDNRMQEDGQYGGGWGDDCEMWRFWVPVLIGFDDPKAVAAQRRFSEALMSQPHMRGGYTSRMTDVEHSAEDSSDVITPMMFLAPDDPQWQRRALRMADLMETLWTGINQRGQLQFKSTYFCVDRVDDNPQRACDTVYHPRAVQPTLLYWQRTGDVRLKRLFSRWMDTWVDASARAERGKPPGIIPSAIHWPDGSAGGLSPPWWDPRNHGEARLYRWPSAMSMMTDTLLLTWHMTGKEKYLEPIRSMAAARRRWLRGPRPESPAPGSEAWCAQQLGLLAGTLAKYKRLTGSSEFDDILKHDYRGAPLAPEEADPDRLAEPLQSSVQALRVNLAGYTSEVRYTDRVLRFPALFEANMMFRQAVPGISRPNPGLLYSVVTGDPGQSGYFPLAAVRWLTPPQDIAAVVTRAGSRQFAAALYHFGTEPRSMGAELYLLEPGAYVYQLTTEKKAPAVGPEPLAVRGPRSRIRFTLPPRTPCRLRVWPAGSAGPE